MKKLITPILAAFLMLVSGIANAQTPCGFDVTAVVIQPTCDKACNGSITITPNQNWFFEYLWSNGSTSNTISDLCEDEYVVTVTDDKKCSQVYTYSIIDPDPVDVSCAKLTDESYCGANDGSIEAAATGGDGNFTYEWQTNPVFVGALLSGIPAGTYTVIVYDGNDCTATTTCSITCEKKEECEGFRTQTQGGWGQCQQTGNNPGTYLFANFDNAFPNDLIIGCNNKLKLTTAQAVCDFLPSGTSPKKLPNGTKVNPGQNYSNVLAGQLVAATLNVQFDLYDPNFGGSAVNLGDLEITVGPFAGWSVYALIDEANKKIGGCASPYSLGDLNTALDSLNKNFKDGVDDKGFLTCPENKDAKIVAPEKSVAVNIYPNPVYGQANINIVSDLDESVEVLLFNVAGQQSASLYKGEVRANEELNIGFEGSSLEAGFYFVKVITGSKVYTQKVVVKN